MPGEFEPHTACWMAWPERPDTWRAAAAPAQGAYEAVARAISGSEPVAVAANPSSLAAAEDALGGAARVAEVPTNDAWMRDIGPTFVVDDAGQVRGVDWQFNAWGGTREGLYADWAADDAAAAAVCALEDCERYRAPLVLEGGAIHVDGQGTLLTTEECLLNPNRNPSLTRSEIEDHLRAYTGAETIIWLERGVVGDETGGHVDNLCCFVRPGVVVLTWTDDRADPQYERSCAARRVLEGARDARGRRLEVHPIRQPAPLHTTDAEARGVRQLRGTKPRCAGDRLTGSYVNYYPANDRVVVPALDPSTDEAAVEVLGSLYPERDVVGVAAREILLGGGGVHCITQPVPRGGESASGAPPVPWAAR
jgi:agmatine deiminase